MHPMTNMMRRMVQIPWSLLLSTIGWLLSTYDLYLLEGLLSSEKRNSVPTTGSQPLVTPATENYDALFWLL